MKHLQSLILTKNVIYSHVCPYYLVKMNKAIKTLLLPFHQGFSCKGNIFTIKQNKLINLPNLLLQKKFS